MMRRGARTAFVITAVAALGCGESTAPASPSRPLEISVPDLLTGEHVTSPRASAQVPSTGPSRTLPPELQGHNVPAEFERDPVIYSYSSFLSGTSVGTASGGAQMSYWATDAVQIARLSTYKEGSSGPSTSANTGDAFNRPGDHSLSTTVTVSFPYECGGAVQASGTHQVWHTWILEDGTPFQWGSTTRASQKFMQQDPCQELVKNPWGQSSGGAGDPTAVLGEPLYLCTRADTYENGRLVSSVYISCVQVA